MPKIFVYGTLRKEGEANQLLSGGTLLEESIELIGFSLFSFGPYPFAIQTSQNCDVIIGDVYEISDTTLHILDDYEGEMYKRIYEADNEFFIYIKKDNNTEFYPRISNGNWLLYNHNK